MFHLLAQQAPPAPVPIAAENEHSASQFLTHDPTGQAVLLFAIIAVVLLAALVIMVIWKLPGYMNRQEARMERLVNTVAGKAAAKQAGQPTATRPKT